MKFIYGLILFVIFVMLLIIFFTNLLYIDSMSMYLFGRGNSISFSGGLLLVMFLSMIFGAVSVLLFQSFIKGKPKDILDDDF